jgi:hypothetical protein
MTTQSHRDLYTSVFANNAEAALQRLEAARKAIDALPFLHKQNAYNWDNESELGQRVLQLRALVALAKASGKDWITVTVGDMLNLVHLDIVVQEMEQALGASIED